MSDLRTLPEAIARISARTPIGAALRSREWEGMPLALNERSFFSATVESLRFLSSGKNRLLNEVSGVREKVAKGEAFFDRSSFIAAMRKIAIAEGIAVDPAKRGGLQDITSRARLGLIYDMNKMDAQEYARWKAEQDPDVLAAFPAQELIRVEDRAVPRKWLRIWVAAGGRLFSGRMIALKNDPIWRAISRFGRPWPPFDFNSGMGLEDVSRADAEGLGLLGPDDVVTMPEVSFNEALQASIRSLGPMERVLLKQQFGDQIEISDEAVQWRGNTIADFVQKALSNPDWKDKISLGVATKATVDAAKGMEDLSGYELQLTADEVRHAMAQHGEGAEWRAGQIGIRPDDFAVIADVWRSPDSIKAGDRPGSLLFVKSYGDWLTGVLWRMSAKRKTAFLQTLYKKKGEGAS